MREYDPYDMFGGGTTTRTPPRRAPAPARSRSPQPRRPSRRPPPPSSRATPRRPGGGGRAAGARPRRPTHARGNPFRRLRLIVLLFGCLFALVVGRLAQLQVVDGGRLDALGRSQVTQSTPLPADRGSILDRNGADLALSVPRVTVWADPRFVVDAEATAAALAPVLGIDAPSLVTRLVGGEGDAFEYLARQVEPDVAARVEELGLPGIHQSEEHARFHPAGDLARAVLGAVDVDGAGVAGLERQYEDLLGGEPGQLVVERDMQGRTIPQGDHEVVPAVAGHDLVLTLDRGMQYAAERALADRIVAMGARGGTVIVSDPRTGEIFAMANLVTDPETGRPVATGGNAAVTSVFEPGSVNKVITLAAALEEGVVDPTTHLDVPDRLQVADHLFTDHDPHRTSSWTPTDILATSSNVGTIMLGQRLGPDRVDEYLRRFGFGERTALGFPDESPGLLLPVDDWSGTSIGSIPIGQGVAVTPMQMLAAYNVIANDGVYVEPRLVLATTGPDGVRHPVPAGEERRVVSATTAGAVRDMMVAVVDAGTGREAAIEGYSVAGKTGTARKPQANGTYQDALGRYHYVTTFAGFVPAQDPRLSIIVVVDEPSNGFYASQVAAPVFAELARYGLRQFRIPPPAAPFVPAVPRPTAAEEPIVDEPAPTTAPVRGEAAFVPDADDLDGDGDVDEDDDALAELLTAADDDDGSPPTTVEEEEPGVEDSG